MEVKELVALVDKAYNQNKIVKDFDQKKKDATKALDEMKAKILNHLEENQLDNFSTNECMVYTVTKESVKFPDKNEDKQKVFNYIEKKYGKDTLMGFITINSATFNSFYNSEAENALDANGNIDLDFTIDGVAPAKGYTRLNLKKKG